MATFQWHARQSIILRHSTLQPAPIPSSLKKTQRKVVSQGLIPNYVWVKVVPRVVARQQLRGCIRVSQNTVEIKHRVEDVTHSDECIDSLTGLLAFGIRVWLCIIGGWRGTEWSDGCSKERKARGMNSSCHLLIRDDEPISDLSLRLHIAVCNSNVVDTFEDHSIFHVRLCQHVPVHPADDIRTESIMQDAVSSCGLVENGYALGGLVLLHSRQKQIWPSIICQPQYIRDIGSTNRLFALVVLPWPSVMLSPMMANELE